MVHTVEVVTVGDQTALARELIVEEREMAQAFEAAFEAYDDLMRWIPEHGYRPTGPPRERYLSEPTVPPEQIETIVEMPVEKAAA